MMLEEYLKKLKPRMLKMFRELKVVPSDKVMKLKYDIPLSALREVAYVTCRLDSRETHYEVLGVPFVVNLGEALNICLRKSGTPILEIHTHNMSIAVPSSCDIFSTTQQVRIGIPLEYTCIARLRTDEKVRALCIHVPSMMRNLDSVVKITEETWRKAVYTVNNINVGIAVLLGDKDADKLEKEYVSKLRDIGVKAEIIDI